MAEWFSFRIEPRPLARDRTPRVGWRREDGLEVREVLVPEGRLWAAYTSAAHPRGSGDLFPPDGNRVATAEACMDRVDKAFPVKTIPVGGRG